MSKHIRKAPPLRPPVKYANVYASQIEHKIVEPLFKKIENRLALAESNYNSIRDKLRDIQTNPSAYTAEAQKLADGTIAGLNAYHKRVFRQSMRRHLGIDVTDLLNEPAMKVYMLQRIRENVDLITRLPKHAVDKLGDDLQKLATTKPFSRADVHSAVQKRHKTTTSHAKLIARDQTSKAIGQFTKQRQQDVGFKEYEWLSAGDERVRATHAANDGTIFRWDSPPITGHPGDEIQCRCVARAVMRSYKRPDGKKPVAPIEETPPIKPATTPAPPAAPPKPKIPVEKQTLSQNVKGLAHFKTIMDGLDDAAQAMRPELFQIVKETPITPVNKHGVLGQCSAHSQAAWHGRTKVVNEEMFVNLNPVLEQLGRKTSASTSIHEMMHALDSHLKGKELAVLLGKKWSVQDFSLVWDFAESKTLMKLGKAAAKEADGLVARNKLGNAKYHTSYIGKFWAKDESRVYDNTKKNAKQAIAKEADIPIEDLLDVSPEYLTVNTERYLMHRLPEYFETHHKGKFLKKGSETELDYDLYRKKMKERSPALLKLLDYLFEGLEDRMKLRSAQNVL